MAQKTRQLKKLCACKNCGNEAEMVVTCTLDEVEAGTPDAKPEASNQEQARRVRGSATCIHCGNEADMWIDI